MVIGQGGTPEQALRAAKAARPKEVPEINYVPTTSPLEFPPIFTRVREALLALEIAYNTPIYLVGGAVRDALLKRPTKDLDFVSPGQALTLARRIADALGGAYFTLDEERQTGRVLVSDEQGQRFILDFATQRGTDIESDLRARDYTVNAMAVELREPQKLLDPMGGTADLKDKRLRVCTSQACTADPIRVLRGIRLAAIFNFHAVPETRQLWRQAAAHLQHVSPERLRDEILLLLEGPKPGTAVRALEMLGALPYLLPELTSLRGIPQSPPHQDDVWEHTLHVVDQLEALLKALSPEYEPETATELALGLAVLRLGRYRSHLKDHFNTPLTSDRSPRAVLFFATLYHDIAKPQTIIQPPDGHIRFPEHEVVGSTMAARRARELHFSNAEVQRVADIVRYHPLPRSYTKDREQPTPRTIYRFFKAAGPAGVDTCLLSLADNLATYGHVIPPEIWSNHLDVVRALFEAWWEYPTERLSPPPLLSGEDLKDTFNLTPGPIFGQILDSLQEAQAVGEIKTRTEAQKWVRSWLEKHKNS
ncbi:MAG: HD domain-containing protein [Chloroflexota bacterium]